MRLSLTGTPNRHCRGDVQKSYIIWRGCSSGSHVERFTFWRASPGSALGITALVVLVLGLGLGGATAMFSVVNGVLLHYGVPRELDPGSDVAIGEASTFSTAIRILVQVASRGARTKGIFEEPDRRGR